MGASASDAAAPRAAKVSGARFAFYRGALARLELAVVQFFLDSARERGYLELLPPYLVNADSMRGTGQLPKFEEDLFKTTRGDYLISTAEVPVTNYHRDEILEGARLPLKYCAFSPCFRSEAGSYGKDTRGLIRQHQFHKVELVRFEKPENAQDSLEELVRDAQAPLQKLGLHHRVSLLCTADLGFSAENPMSPLQSSTSRWCSPRRRSGSCASSTSCSSAACTSSAFSKRTSSTLWNWCWRMMPLVSLP